MACVYTYISLHITNIYIICIYTHIAPFRAQHDLKPSGCGWSGRNWRSGRVVGNIVFRVSIVERPSNCSSPAFLTMPPNAPKCPPRCSSCTRRVMRKLYSFLLIYPLVIFVRTFTNLQMVSPKNRHCPLYQVEGINSYPPSHLVDLRNIMDPSDVVSHPNNGVSLVFWTIFMFWCIFSAKNRFFCRWLPHRTNWLWYLLGLTHGFFLGVCKPRCPHPRSLSRRGQLGRGQRRRWGLCLGFQDEGPCKPKSHTL